MIGLGDLPGGNTASTARAVSADGQVIVGNGSDVGGPAAFQWRDGTGMVPVGDLPGGATGSFAHGVSDDGSVIVGVGSSTNGAEAFRWTANDGMVGLGVLSTNFGFLSEAHGVSDDGSVVVGVSTSVLTGEEAYRWTPQTGMVGIGWPAGAFQSEATNVSADGQVIVGMSIGAGWHWSELVGFELLGSLPGGTGGDFRSEPLDLTPDGSIIVGTSETDIAFGEAFIWDAVNGIRDMRDMLMQDFALDLTGWMLRTASGISADGRTIVGTGVNPNGFTEAWIATIPEPASAILLLLGTTMLLRRRV